MYAERKYEHNNDKIRLIVFKCHITYLKHVKNKIKLILIRQI